MCKSWRNFVEQFWRFKSLNISELDELDCPMEKGKKKVIEWEQLRITLEMSTSLTTFKFTSKVSWMAEKATVEMNGQMYILLEKPKMFDISNKIYTAKPRTLNIVINVELSGWFEAQKSIKYVEALRALLKISTDAQYYVTMPVRNILKIEEIPVSLDTMRLEYCPGTTACNVSFEVHEVHILHFMIKSTPSQLNSIFPVHGWQEQHPLLWH